MGGVHPLSEHRRVTVAFLHFDGTDRLIEEEGPDETARRLETLVTVVQQAVDNQQVTFLATDVDRDGGKIILTAGAPSTSGDDDHRMLLAVREIMDAGSPLPVRIGVHRGSVFVGEVGPPYRRTFTVMGDAVNLAARLMAKASRVRSWPPPTCWRGRPPASPRSNSSRSMVKGKSKPVAALALGAKTAGPSVRATIGPTDDLSFVGRLEEMAVRCNASADDRRGRSWLAGGDRRRARSG